MKQALSRTHFAVIGVAFVLLAIVAYTVRPSSSIEVTTPELDQQWTSPELADAVAVAVLPPLDDGLIPFPDEDPVAFDAMQDPDGGPRQAFEWFWRQRAYPLTTVPFDASSRALAQARSAAQSMTHSADVQQLNWQLVGPAPLQGVYMGWDGTAPIRKTAAGRVTAIAIPRDNSNILYVASSTGGVWKSTDAGANYVSLTHDRPEYAFQSLAIDPQNSNTIYAGTGQFNTYYGSGLLKSTDAGQSWTTLGKDVFGPLMITAVYVHPTNSNIVVVSTATLAGLHSGDSLPRPVPNSGIYRSTDGGQNWQLVQSCDPCGRGFTDMVMDGSNAQQPVFYAASAGVGVFKSTDAGVTWQKLTNFDTAVGRVAYRRVELAIGEGAGANTVYAALDGETRNGSRGIVMRTTNGGQSWQEVPAAAGFCDPQCFHDMVIGINPQNPNDIFFGGVDMFRSTDGGVTVNNISSVNGIDVGLHVDQMAITFDPNNPAIVWVGNDGGVYRFANNVWEARNNGMSTLQFIGIGVNPVDGSQAVGGMQDNSQAYWDGTSWQGFDFADGNKGEWDPFDLNTVYYGDQQISFRVSQQVNIDALRAGGENRLNGISPQANSQFYIPFEVDPVRQGVLYLGTDKLYRTADRGQNWVAISEPFGGPTVTSIGVARSNGNIVYLGTSFGQIFQGVQQGGRWTFTDRSNPDVLPPRLPSDIAVSPTDANTLYITYNGFSANTPSTPGHVFKSTDGGQNWVRLDGVGQAVIPDIPVLSIVLDPGNPGHIYVGTDIGVFYSTNDGQSWINDSQGLPPIPVQDLKYVAPVKQLWAATYGRSIWRTTLGAPAPNPTATPTLVPTSTPVNPTNTPTPTNTPVPPPTGARPGQWGNDVSFLVAADQQRLFNLAVVVVSETNCRQVLGTPGPITIAADGSFTYSFQNRDTSWMVTGEIDGETATGTVTLNNIQWETSLCGDSVTTTRDWTATWRQSAPDPTPTPLPSPTPAPQATNGINGQVRASGQGVAGINVWLVACPNEGECDPTANAPVAQAKTDPGGFYNITNAPTLPAGQYYFVYYLNDEQGGNIANDNYLYRWFGPVLEQYTAGAAVDGGSFDIGDIVLLTPADGQSALPQQFTWRQRAVAAENYVWVMYDANLEEEICRGPIANAVNFTLTLEYVTTNCAPAVAGGNFVWFVWAVDGTDFDAAPSGDSFFVGEITLSADGGLKTYLPNVKR